MVLGPGILPGSAYRLYSVQGICTVIYLHRKAHKKSEEIYKSKDETIIIYSGGRLPTGRTHGLMNLFLREEKVAEEIIKNYKELMFWR